MSETTTQLTAAQVLTAMANDNSLATDVLNYLDHGMRDEWDCGLLEGVFKLGFAEQELAIAAKSGLALAEYHEKHGGTWETDGEPEVASEQPPCMACGGAQGNDCRCYV